MKLKNLNLENINKEKLMFVFGGKQYCHTSKKHGRPHSDTLRKDERTHETTNK